MIMKGNEKENKAKKPKFFPLYPVENERIRNKWSGYS